MNTKVAFVADVGAEKLVERLEAHWKTAYRDRTTVVDVAGYDVLVFPGVYTPEAPVTRTMAHAMAVPDNATVLDMGCGTGVYGIVALHRGATHAVFVDISATAIENTRANVDLHAFRDRTELVHADLFEGMGNRKFDVIFFNAPFLFVDGPVTKDTLGETSTLWNENVPPPTSFFDDNYAVMTQFLEIAPRHLDDGGFIQFAFGNLGNGERFNSLVDEFNLSKRQIGMQVTDEYEWYAYELRPRRAMAT